MSNILKNALAAVRGYVVRNPARVISAAAAAVVFVAAKLGVVIPRESVVHAIEVVVPVLLSGEATHRLVTPVATLPAPAPVAPVVPAPVAPAPAAEQTPTA